MNPLDINDAIALLKETRYQIADKSSFGWDKLYNAHQHLERQLKAYFADEYVPEFKKVA